MGAPMDEPSSIEELIGWQWKPMGGLMSDRAWLRPDGFFTTQAQANIADVLEWITTNFPKSNIALTRTPAGVDRWTFVVEHEDGQWEHESHFDPRTAVCEVARKLWRVIHG